MARRLLNSYNAMHLYCEREAGSQLVMADVKSLRE